MNRRRIDTEGDRLWVVVLSFLVALAVAALLSVDDYEPRPRPPGRTEVDR